MAKSESVKVRVLTAVLVEGVSYAGNQVVAFPAEIAKQLKAAGSVDDAKEAVAFCLSEGAEVVEHAPQADAEE